MHKRRQMADANPKNLTHFAGPSTSSSNRIQSTNDFRPTKSIIIGAGQPIIVPGQYNVTSSTSIKSSSITPAFNQQQHQTAQPLITNTTTEDLQHYQTVISVEEFCPDGEQLDKNFLDDMPNSTSMSSPSTTNIQIQRTIDTIDSDSDCNENGNPLVTNYHDDPGDDSPTSTSFLKQSNNIGRKEILPLKVNPLAKGKNKSLNSIQLHLSMTPHRTSISSDDIEIGASLKVSGSNGDGQSSSGISNEEFDSWLLDTNQRRSPEGGEDITMLPNIDKITIIDDDDTCNGITALQNDSISLDDGLCTATEEKKTKHKSKKKSKKERHDKDEKTKKKKNRSKLNECDGVSIPSGTYEAL